MRTFLPLAFWYWLYNQLFFFLGALGFFVIHFLVAFIGFGGMDTLASGILITLYALILYKLFGRFLWRSRPMSLRLCSLSKWIFSAAS